LSFTLRKCAANGAESTHDGSWRAPDKKDLQQAPSVNRGPGEGKEKAAANESSQAVGRLLIECPRIGRHS
jgi:hypothetical protein